MQDSSRIGTQEIHQPPTGKKPLSMGCGPCLGSEDDGKGKQGTEGGPLFRV